MKTYFTKYLSEPVIKKNGTLLSRLYSIDPIIKEMEKPKLFLCSRDIQIGDKYRITGGFADDIEFEFKEGQPKRNSAFKIIGEVSKDATWVKEGDEFDEEDWRWVTYEWDTEIIISKEKMIGINKKEVPISLQIKGPCGHFH